MKIKEKDIRRFETKFIKGKNNECWIWIGHKAKNGYGSFRMPTRNWIASRFAFMIKHKKDPGKKYVCHKCDIKLCVNPSHLFLGTAGDNMQDMLKKGRGNFAKGETHCCAKITDKEVKQIRKLFAKQKLSQKEIGKQFKVCQSNISRIVNLVTRIL